MFCGYRIWNKQFTRKKVLLSAWIRQECRAKPLTNEFKRLMHLNSCLFKIPRSNIYINLKETDIFHYFCFTWNNSRNIRWRRRPRFHVKQIWVILFFFNKTERNKGGFLTRNEVYLKILRIKLQKRIKILKIKRKWS